MRSFPAALSTEGSQRAHPALTVALNPACSLTAQIQVARYINDDRIEVDDSLRVVLDELERDQPTEFAGPRSVAGGRGGRQTDGRNNSGRGGGGGGGWGDDSYAFEERGGGGVGGGGGGGGDDADDSTWARSFAARMLGQEGLSGGSGTSVCVLRVAFAFGVGGWFGVERCGLVSASAESGSPQSPVSCFSSRGLETWL